MDGLFWGYVEWVIQPAGRQARQKNDKVSCYSSCYSKSPANYRDLAATWQRTRGRHALPFPPSFIIYLFNWSSLDVEVNLMATIRRGRRDGWLTVKNNRAKGGHRSKSWPVALLSLLCVTHTVKGAAGWMAVYLSGSSREWIYFY